MFNIYPLFSSSSGNSIFIEDNYNKILIDIGVTTIRMERALAAYGIHAKSINSIFITHEHSDHVAGLKVFIKKYNTKIYASYGTISKLLTKEILNSDSNFQIIDKTGVNLNNMYITPFDISHDCEQGFGYNIYNSSYNTKISVCCDLGMISNQVLNSIIGSKIIFIESNHDINMLNTGKYSYYLKQRILSKKGHLSNDSCAEILPELAKHGARQFILSHLSTENNTPELAYNTALHKLESAGLKSGYEFSLKIAPKINNINFTIRN
ncbi:MAG: MBL fold metallo-hydrolase [Candidatus Improbicoccus devescovinae]|nr:MAG: MBL fold metallo-hydrolase [Candidatus Improbicoccus devescovinae]